MSIRNVVILGKVGAGKRTLGNHIAGARIFQCKTALGTGDVDHHYEEHTREGILYRILTIDTESLQTGYNDPVPYIRRRFKFQKIHSIIFAIPHGRYTDESHGSLVHAIENLNQQAKSISALVITHCEGMTDEQRKCIIAEFSSNARSSQVVGFIDFGIYAVGFPDTSTLPHHLKPILQNGIEKDEEVMKNLLEMCAAPVPVENISATGAQRPYQRPSILAAFKRQAMASKKSYSEEFYRTEQKDAETDDLKSGQIVRKRCVVLIGKSGAGKSTVANHIVGHDPLSDYAPPFGISEAVLASVTREVKHEMVEFKRGSILYRVTVIDTVGLFDTSIPGQDSIFEKIETYLNDYIEGVNLILFIFKKGRFTAEEKEVFEYIRNKFTMEISPISALAVTQCENDTPQGRAKLVREFYDNGDTNPIARQMRMGIHPVGFPPLKLLLPALRVAYNDTMEQDREALRDLIIRAEKPHLTRKLFEKVKKWGCTIL